METPLTPSPPVPNPAPVSLPDELAPPSENRLVLWRDRLEDYTRREPIRVLVIAVVAGLIVGRLLRPLRLKLAKQLRPAPKKVRRRLHWD